MRQVFLTGRGKIEVVDVPVPSRLVDSVLVRNACSLISTGTELTILSGEYPPDSHWSRYGKLPFVAGYSNVGEVIEVGAGVDPGWISRRAATHGPHGSSALEMPLPSAQVPRWSSNLSTTSENRRNGRCAHALARIGGLRRTRQGAGPRSTGC